jgi:hypothetical protein
MKKIILVLTFILNNPMHARAAQFTGFKFTATDQHLELVDSVARFIEVDDEVKILFVEHAAFYRLQVDKASSKNVRDFLNRSIREKSKLRADIDPYTARIFSLSSVKLK